MKTNWFGVDKEGLAKVLERSGGKAFVIYELLQNAWDEEASRVVVTLQPVEGKPLCRLTVIDDSPDGFCDLKHAFTLFAESPKKGDPSKRGRFNIGEKLVLACCESATIRSTTGSVVFSSDGERRSGRKRTEAGTVLEAMVRLTRSEYDDIRRSVRHVLPPITTTFNTQLIPSRATLKRCVATLLTEVADDKGALRRRPRQTQVAICEPLPGEHGRLYELGIPVLETGDMFDVDIEQKVPLNMERENVAPSYLRAIRTLVLNEMHQMVTGKDSANAEWVRDAIEDKDCSQEALKKVVTERFGQEVVAYDPSDEEANKRAVSAGMTVIAGGTFTGNVWGRLKAHGIVKPAGQVTPSPKPYSPDGDALMVVPPSEWTPGMKAVADYAVRIGNRLIEQAVTVTIARDVTWPFSATYGRARLTLNLGKLGHRFFDEFPHNLTELNNLLIHEYGHEFSNDHLSASPKREWLPVHSALIDFTIATMPSLTAAGKAFHASTTARRSGAKASSGVPWLCSCCAAVVLFASPVLVRGTAGSDRCSTAEPSATSCG